MGGIVSGIFGGGGGGGGGGDTAAASRYAADVAAQAERDKLNYLKEQSRLPNQYRDRALGDLANLYGMNSTGTYAYNDRAARPASFIGGASPTETNRFLYKERTPPQWQGSGADPLQGVYNNPVYQAQMANITQMDRDAMNRSMASAAATGGVRGGNLQRSFADMAVDRNLAENNALAQAYQQQIANLQSMAGLDTNTNAIANSMGNIGQIQSQGIIGAAQSQQAANQAQTNNQMGLLNLGLGVASLFSDVRLKTNIKKTGKTNHPQINVYQWDWNEKAQEIGADSAPEFGYLAQEVITVWPDLVGKIGEFYTVNHAEITERLNYVH